MSKQIKGGFARAEKLSTEERRTIAQNAARARWNRLKSLDRIAKADSYGVLAIGDVELDVYVLDDKRRVISKRAMAKALQLKSQGGNAFMRTMTRKNIRPIVSQQLWDTIEAPIAFTGVRGESCDGFEADTLIEVCDMFIEARNRRVLSPSQHFLAVQSEVIVRSAAKLGIIALIDEAAGYTDKTLDEYKRLFDQFIRSEFKQWEKEFPDKFFSMIYRLYGLKRQKPDSTRHPQFFGHFIRKFVYYPLANSNGAILDQLDKKNPVVYAGGSRRYKLFQYLSDEVGDAAFRQHLWQVVGIGEASTDKSAFERSFYRAFPEAIPRKVDDQMDFLDLLRERPS